MCIVALRLTGMHEHFCFDGGAPPVSVHFWDDANLHEASDSEAQAREPHSDKDVALSGNLLVKRFEASPDIRFLVSAIAVVPLLSSEGNGSEVRFDDPPLALGAPHSHLRPPLRGPPVLTSTLV